MRESTTLEQVKLSWSPKFLLRDAFLHQKSGGGIYVWGFRNQSFDVIWYVGKATTGKGVYPRLRKHYLDAMSGQYQIPLGYIQGAFTSSESSQSGWEIKYGDPEIAARLRDWRHMENIFRAGHAFANEAFARVALLDVPDSHLKAIERHAIQLLRPVVNRQRSKPDSSVGISFEQSSEDLGWIEDWKRQEQLFGQPAAGGA